MGLCCDQYRRGVFTGDAPQRGIQRAGTSTHPPFHLLGTTGHLGAALLAPYGAHGGRPGVLSKTSCSLHELSAFVMRSDRFD